MIHSTIFKGLLGSLAAKERLLLAVATPLEAGAVLSAFSPARPDDPTHDPKPWSLFPVADRIDLVVTGVGKSPAAAAVASILALGAHGGVLNLGIAGSLPSASALRLLDTILASSHHFADEGVARPPVPGHDSFTTLHAMGFAPPGTVQGSVPSDDAWTNILRSLLPQAQFSPIATVSTCSGTDALAHAIAARTAAAAEAMEGAAIALAARNLGRHYAELRIISNTTGDRPGQVWDLRGALARLTALLISSR